MTRMTVFKLHLLKLIATCVACVLAKLCEDAVIIIKIQTNKPSKINPMYCVHISVSVALCIQYAFMCTVSACVSACVSADVSACVCKCKDV